jgi:hypothetical protein
MGSLRVPGRKNFPLFTRLSMARSTSAEGSIVCEEAISAITYPRIVKQRHSCHRAAMLSLLLYAVVKQSFSLLKNSVSYQIWKAVVAAPRKLDAQEPAMPAARSRTWFGGDDVCTKDQSIGLRIGGRSQTFRLGCAYGNKGKRNCAANRQK